MLFAATDNVSVEGGSPVTDVFDAPVSNVRAVMECTVVVITKARFIWDEIRFNKTNLHYRF